MTGRQPLVRGFHESDLLRYAATNSQEPYTPRLLSSPVLWLDYDDETTQWRNTARTVPVVSNNDNVAYVDNKFGIGFYDARMGTSSRQPTSKTNRINGRRVASFSTDDALDIPFGFAWTGGGFWWLVVRPTLKTGAYQRIVSMRTPVDYDYNSANTVIWLRGPAIDDKIIWEANELAADKIACFVGPTVDGVAYYLRGFFSGSSASMSATGFPSQVDTFSPVDPSPGRITIGSQLISLPSPAYQEHFEGDIGEFGVAIGPQSPLRLVQHDAYMLAKWGLA